MLKRSLIVRVLAVTPTRETKTQGCLLAPEDVHGCSKITMKLTQAERERITDSVLKIQSVRASLDHMDEDKVPKLEEMEESVWRAWTWGSEEL